MSGIGRKVLALCLTVLLARLLSPAEFGAVAIITALVALGQVLQQAGLSSATIQRERVSVQAVSTMFWINSTVGLTLTVLFAMSAHSVAHFFKHPELAVLCRVTSMTFVLNGLVAQHRALLQRSMRFATTARIDIGSALVGGLSAIAIAAAGHGYWALVAQFLISDSLALLMLVRAARWKLTRPALTNEVRQMVAFGCSMLGFNLVVTAANSLPVVALGRGSGTSAAGIYTRSYALASIPQSLLQGAAAFVAFPKLSRVQRDDSSFASFYYRGVQLLSLVTLPIVLAFAVFGDQIALLVYGPRWGNVSDLLQVFAIGLAVTPLLHSTGPVMLARGQAKRLLRWGMFGATAMMAGTLIGIRWGTIGVAWGWSISTVLLLLPCLTYSFRETSLTFLGLFRAVGGIYAAAGCALPLAWAGRELAGDLPLLLAAPLALGFSLLVFLTLCYYAFGQQALIKTVIERLLPRSGQAAQ